MPGKKKSLFSSFLSYTLIFTLLISNLMETRSLSWAQETDDFYTEIESIEYMSEEVCPDTSEQEIIVAQETTEISESISEQEPIEQESDDFLEDAQWVNKSEQTPEASADSEKAPIENQNIEVPVKSPEMTLVYKDEKTHLHIQAEVPEGAFETANPVKLDVTDLKKEELDLLRTLVYKMDLELEDMPLYTARIRFLDGEKELKPAKPVELHIYLPEINWSQEGFLLFRCEEKEGKVDKESIVKAIKEEKELKKEKEFTSDWKERVSLEKKGEKLNQITLLMKEGGVFSFYRKAEKPAEIEETETQNPENEIESIETDFITEVEEIIEETTDSETETEAGTSNLEEKTEEETTIEEETEGETSEEETVIEEETEGETSEEETVIEEEIEGETSEEETVIEEETEGETSEEETVIEEETEGETSEEETTIEEETEDETTEETSEVSTEDVLCTILTYEDAETGLRIEAEIPEGTFETENPVELKVSALNPEDLEQIRLFVEQNLMNLEEITCFAAKIYFTDGEQEVIPANPIDIRIWPADTEWSEAGFAIYRYEPEAEAAILTEIQKREEQDAGTEWKESVLLEENEEKLSQITLSVREGGSFVLYRKEAEEEIAEEIEIRTFLWENEDVSITISGTSEAFPETMDHVFVTPLVADNEETAAQYEEVSEHLQNKAEAEDYSIAGFLAYDISLRDLDDNQLEPNAPISVSIEYHNAVIPEEVQNAINDLPMDEDYSVDVTVMHLKEDEEGSVETVENLADQDNSGQIVNVEVNEDNQIEKAEFITESFSTYTITWNVATNNSFKFENNAAYIFYYKKPTGRDWSGKPNRYEYYALGINSNNQMKAVQLTNIPGDGGSSNSYVDDGCVWISSEVRNEYSNETAAKFSPINDRTKYLVMWNMQDGFVQDYENSEQIVRIGTGQVRRWNKDSGSGNYAYLGFDGNNNVFYTDYGSSSSTWTGTPVIYVARLKGANLYFDGTLGGITAYGNSPNECWQDQMIGSTVKLPETWTSPSKYNYRLNGWVDVANGKWYAPGADYKVTGNAVFYADWVPATFDVGTSNHSVTSLDTNSFITTRLFDYNVLFNIYSSKPEITYNGTSHTEKWKYNTNYDVNAYPESMKMNDFRLLDWTNINGKIDYPYDSKQNDYTGGGYNYIDHKVMYSNYWNTKIKNALFNTASEHVGVTYVGEGNYLYQYFDKDYPPANNNLSQEFKNNHDGYYYYDARFNAASYNQSAQRFYVYDYLERTTSSYNPETKKEDSDNSYKSSDFLPFNAPTLTTSDKYQTSYNQNVNVRDVKYTGDTLNRTIYTYDSRYDLDDCKTNRTEADLLFGMSSEIQFYLPDNSNNNGGNGGNISDKGLPLKFEFSGDDDVWVFVDGQLVLDMSGIHAAMSGEINFQTGEVSRQESNSKTAPMVKTTPGYFTAGDHTLTIYYLERGSSMSNCGIWFNISPRYSLDLNKSAKYYDESKVLTTFTGCNPSLEGTKFSFYTDKECSTNALLWDQSSTTNTKDNAKNTFEITAKYNVLTSELINAGMEQAKDKAGNLIYLSSDKADATTTTTVTEYPAYRTSYGLSCYGFRLGETYYLKEIEAADGYHLPSTLLFEFKVTASGNEIKIVNNNTDLTSLTKEQQAVVNDILNTFSGKTDKFNVNTHNKTIHIELDNLLKQYDFEFTKKLRQTVNGDYEPANENAVTFKLYKLDHYDDPSNNQSPVFSDQVYATANTDATGKVSFSKIEPGKYKMVEERGTSGLTGYDYENQFIVELTKKAGIVDTGTVQITKITETPARSSSATVEEPDSTAGLDYVIKNNPYTASLEIRKVDDEDNPLSDVSFKLTAGDAAQALLNPNEWVNQEDEWFKQETTNQEGIVTFTNLPDGTYSLNEMPVSGDYKYLESVIPITITNGVVSATPWSSIAPNPTADGNVVSKIEASYEFVEGATEIYLKVTNPKLHNLEFIKKKEVLNDGTTEGTFKDILAEGIVFELWSAGENAQKVATATSDSSGTVKFEALTAEEYELRELAVNGYDTSAVYQVKKKTDESKDYEITQQDNLEGTGTSSDPYIIKNKLYKAEFDIIKEDDAGNKLNGIEFTLTQKTSDSGVKLGTGGDGITVQTTAGTDVAGGDAGKITFTDLVDGTYILEETNSNGYIGLVQEIELTIKNGVIIIADDKKTGDETVDDVPGASYKWDFTTDRLQLTVKNPCNTHSLKLTKVSSVEPYDKLSGAEFEFYSDFSCEVPAIFVGADGKRNPILKKTTDSNGLIEIDGLLPGTYFIKEVKAPAGYLVIKEVLAVTLDGDGKITVAGQAVLNDDNTVDIQGFYRIDADESDASNVIVNNCPLYDLPSAGGTGIFLYMISGMLLIIAGALIYILKKYKEVFV